ncbi:MAG: hypothetical protein II177_03225, partial [Lachnospiraceae bacterium]|nr:hypothetical protein [Lachnospiraceae bacterium]
MRKKILAILLASGLAVTGVSFTQAPAEAATEKSQNSSDEDLAVNGFHIEAKKLKNRSSDSSLRSKDSSVGASSSSTSS